MRKAKLVRGDLSYIRKLTQKCANPSQSLQNSVPEISLAHGILSLYEERIGKPTVYIPPKEYNQKDDTTPLPASNMQTHMRDLSIRALNAWEMWTSQTTDTFHLPNDDTVYTPISQDVVDLLLGTDEIQQYNQYKDDVVESDSNWKDLEEAEFKRISNVVPSFRGCEIGLIKREIYNRTYADSLELSIKSDYETARWRKEYRSEESHLIPNCGMKDDPDFIPPLSSNGNFISTPPAMRMYNAVFKIFFSDKTTRVLAPEAGGPKDYTDVNDIYFLYLNKGITLDDVSVEFARYEVDLRVTYSDEPDPKNYKKVDPQGGAGIKLMSLLNEQPNLWKEYTWLHEGEEKMEKKVAYGLTFTNSVGDKSTYWIYLKDTYVKIGSDPIYNKKPLPRVSYDHIIDNNGDKQLIIARLTYHTSKASLRVNPAYKEENPDASDYVIDNLVNDLNTKGYVQAKESEDLYGLITVTFLRNDVLTKKARDKFVLSDTEWKLKYSST